MYILKKLHQRLLKTEDLERRVKRRLEQQRSKEVTRSISMLIVQDGEKVLIRKKRVSWLEGLSMDWELKERTRWRDVVPGVLNQEQIWSKTIPE